MLTLKELAFGIVGAGIVTGVVYVSLLLLNSPYNTPPTIVKHYRAGLMERVEDTRGLTRPAGVDGYAATTECSRIGGVVELSIKSSPIEDFFVVDCSAPVDRERHIKEGLIAEVDWETAVRHGFAWDGNTYFGDGHAPATFERFYTAQQWAKRNTNK